MIKIKLLSIVHIFMLVFLLSGCSTKESKLSETISDTSPTFAAEVTIMPDIALTPTDTPSLTTTVLTYDIPNVNIESKETTFSESLKFVKDMKIGWNLGNTFDAYTDSPWFSDELGYETAWSGVVTSQEMIDMLIDAGFNSIRIPVSWHNHVSGDEFVISDLWLQRVQEVVDYAYNKGMYVILNTHHDINEAYYYPNNDYLEISKKYIEQIWSQLAVHFADYDDHLIFESMNEPRLVGTNYEWWLDTSNDSCMDAVNTINILNQIFVDSVRNNKGNNNKRYIMVPGYCASAQGVLIDEFQLPKDIVSDKIIVSVHAYTPYNFALQAPTEADSISVFSLDNLKSTNDINQFMDQLYNKFIRNGIPVIIGEFGARDKNDNTQDRINFSAYYIAKARANGITCFWWDNNSFRGNGENFGLLDRKTLTWKYREIVDSLMKYAQ